MASTCASCGGDPGGIVWEGLVLVGTLTVDDIYGLLGGAVDRRRIVELFTSRIFLGTKVGKNWQIRASRFVEGWEQLERRASRRTRRVRRAKGSRRALPGVIQTTAKVVSDDQ